MDKYKIKQLEICLENMEEDWYFFPRLDTGEGGKHINLDKEAIKMLIAFYRGDN